MKDRLQQLLNTLGLTATRLADEIQVQRSGISHILSGRNQPSFDFLTRLINRYPEIDTRWLMTGAGEILIRDKEKLLDTSSTTTKEPIKDDPSDFKSEEILSNHVTYVTKISGVILLHSDGTFESFSPGKPH